MKRNHVNVLTVVNSASYITTETIVGKLSATSELLASKLDTLRGK